MYSYMSLICVKTFSRYTFIIYNFNRKQVCIHDSISHVRWAGALMEVRSLFGLNSAVKKTGDGPMDGWTNRRTDGLTDLHIESRVRD